MLFPVELAPQPSRLVMAGLVAGHLVLGLAFLRSSLPVIGVALALVSLLGSAMLSYRRWRRTVGLRFVLAQDGAIQVIPPAGPAYEARAGCGCRDLGWAVWLAWRGTAEEGGHGRENVLMLPCDALAPEARRALRIWLKFRSGLGASD
jgi:toxin CptA